MTQKNNITVILSPDLRLKQALKNAGIEDPATVEKLTVAGVLTNDDWFYIRLGMGETLQELDMGGASVTEIGSIAFGINQALKSVILPDTLEIIGSNAFRCTALTSITISASVVEIGDWAFADCRKLTSITIPDSVVKIGRKAFAGSGLTSVVIPDSVVEIGAIAFGGCSKLTSVVISGSVTEIRESAFEYCKNLKYVIIPDSVVKIGKCAFAHCYDLGDITIPASTVEIEKYAFHKCGYDAKSSSCTRTFYLEAHPDNPVYASINGKLTRKSKLKESYYMTYFKRNYLKFQTWLAYNAKLENVLEDIVYDDETDDVIWLEPDLMSSTPCFKDTQIAVNCLFEYLQKSAIDDFLRSYPHIDRSQVTGVIKLAQNALFKRFFDECEPQGITIEREMSKVLDELEKMKGKINN